MRVHDVGVARQIGLYSDAIKCSPSVLLFISGAPRISSDSSRPERMEAQAEQGWVNACTALARANKTLLDLVKLCSVKICQYALSAADMPSDVEVCTLALGQSRPTSASPALPALVRPPYPAEDKAIAVDAPSG
jgi:hypothetical protein